MYGTEQTVADPVAMLHLLVQHGLEVVDNQEKTISV